METVSLAKTYQIAQSRKGKGIFSTYANFKMKQWHGIASALATGDLTTAKKQCYELMLGVCWLMRFHPVFTLILILVCLAVWSVIGGAICRISALQTAQGEQIGAISALRFSLNRFGSFFTAPLIPLGMIILISLLMMLISLLVAIPGIGEIIGGLLFVLALLGGFIIALVTIGLVAGFNLMYPTIAVEGSDSFDAISRSFSYIFARPWHMGFYTLVAAVYGSICYLFVRFFVFLVLLSIHSSVGPAINLDSSSMLGIRGKLQAIWPTPQFHDLQPTINWNGLSMSESIGAALIWMWVALAAAMVMAFVVSYLFSVNTTIYLLLRKKVDATDMEDIYLDQDLSELQDEELPSAEASSQPDADQPQPPADDNSKDESTGSDQQENTPDAPGQDEQQRPDEPTM